MASITTTSSTTSANAQLQQLVASLMANDKKPLQALQSQESDLQSRLTIYQGMATKLSGLVTLARTFTAYGSTNPLQTMTVSGNDPTVLEATAVAGTASGTYTIEVQQLASRQVLTSSEVAGADGNLLGKAAESAATAIDPPSAPIGGSSASFSIRVGDSTSTINVKIPAGSTNTQVLTLLAGAINQVRAGVSATVLNVGQGQKRLQLQATQAGTGAMVTEIQDLSGTWMTDLGLAVSAGKAGGAKTSSQSGAEARILINGIPVTADSNVIKDAIPGLTLTLHDLGTQTITVARDEDAEVKQIEGFISQYNSVLDQIRSQTQAADTSTGQTRGALAGDVSFSRLRGGLRNAVTDRTSGSATDLRQLAQIGLTTDQQGHLSDGDAKTLRAALENSPGAVDSIFRDVGNRVVTLLNAYSRAGGILAQDEQSVQASMTRINDRITQTNKTLALRQSSLMNQMAQLASTVDLLNQQKAWLDSLYGTTSTTSSS